MTRGTPREICWIAATASVVNGAVTSSRVVRIAGRDAQPPRDVVA